MSGPSQLHQAGSEFASTITGHNVDLGNKSLTHRDTAETINHNYYGQLTSPLHNWGYEHRGEKRKCADDQEKSRKTIETLLQSLRFTQIDARHDNIRKAHSQTCKWILKKPEYRNWLDPNKVDEHNGFLWIKGKPGAGKSTVMKFLLSNARRGMRNKTILSFFFNARGEELEKSTTGMYRSLLLQMLQQLPRLHSVLEPGLILGISENHDWGVEALRTLFEQAVEGLGDSSVVVFIDALDECDESEIRSMVSSFKSLGNASAAAGVSFQVCLASRHYPHITMPKKIELVLERQDGHEQDIISYLDSELEIGESKLANEIRAQIKEKASGVFMWVVLVTGILQQKYDQGRIHDLKQTLREIPGDLHELFRNILTRDDANKDELLLCIQWVLFARHPLKPEQLYFAIRSHTERTTCKWDRDEVGETAISNFILSSAKGLAEVTRVKQNPSVQFIHESVRDFLLKDNGLRVVLMEGAGNIGAESHDQLKKCCFEYTRSYLAEHGVPAHDSKAHLTQARTTADSEFPFLSYAVQNVLYHANAADDGNISQASFLETFPREEWILYNNVFEDKEVRRHTSEASLLYILAEYNFGSLIQCYRGSQSCFDIEGERYGAPILAAMATGSRPAVRRLLKREIHDEPGESLLRDLCDEYRVKVERKSCLGRGFKYRAKCSLLYYVLQDQDLAVASFAIASPRAYTNTNFRTPLGETSFSVASQQVYDFFDAVKLLIGNGADIEISDMRDKTPLSLAAEKGNVAAVAFLLVNKANVDAKAYGGIPLVCATRGGNQQCMEQLLSAGANVAVVDHRGQTLLFRATESLSAQEAKIRLLIARNLDVQTVDNNGYTALTWSLMQGTVTAESARILLSHEDTIDRTDFLGRTILSHAADYSSHLFAEILDFRKPDFIRLLLDKGADVNRADTSDRSPLSYAVSCIDSQAADCVQLLLERGANPNIVDTNGNTILSYATARAYATGGAVRDLLLKFLNPVKLGVS